MSRSHPSRVSHPCPQRGSAMVEFAAAATAVLILLVGTMNLLYPMFVKGVLGHALRTGARYASVGHTIRGQGHDAAIKQVIQQSSLSLLSGLEGADRIQIRYFDPATAAEVSGNNAGNLLQISVVGYPIPNLAPMRWVEGERSITVRVTDVMERFDGPSPPR